MQRKSSKGSRRNGLKWAERLKGEKLPYSKRWSVNEKATRESRWKLFWIECVERPMPLRGSPGTPRTPETPDAILDVVIGFSLTVEMANKAQSSSRKLT